MKIKMLKAEKRYGLKKGDVLEVEMLKQEPRYAIFLEPPMRQLNLYNEDWKEMKNTRDCGPNVQRLIARKMAIDAVPSGSGFDDALKFLSSKENITQGAKIAAAWTEAACRLVRNAAEPNPWKEATDEDIAGYLLEQIAARDSGGKG